MTQMSEIRKRSGAASPGPWEADDETWADHKPPMVVVVPTNAAYTIADLDGDNALADATFIAHAREDVEALLRVAEAAQSVATFCRSRIESHEGWLAEPDPDDDSDPQWLDGFHTCCKQVEALVATALDSLRPPPKGTGS